MRDKLKQSRTFARIATKAIKVFVPITPTKYFSLILNYFSVHVQQLYLHTNNHLSSKCSLVDKEH